MELNKKQEEALKKEIGEKRFNEIVNPEFDDNKIYLIKKYGAYYKLHLVNYESQSFAWVDLSSSDCWANGTHDTPQEALDSVDNYQVFDSIKDAIDKGFFND